MLTAHAAPQPADVFVIAVPTPLAEGRRPMLAHVHAALRALAHLVANGTLAHLVLFGGFLLWSVLVFKASRQRDRALDVQYPAGALVPTAITAGLGLLLWLATLGWLHGMVIGVRLMG